METHTYVHDPEFPDECNYYESNVRCNLPERAGVHLVTPPEALGKQLTLTLTDGQLGIGMNGAFDPFELAFLSLILHDMALAVLKGNASVSPAVKLGVRDHLKKRGSN